MSVLFSCTHVRQKIIHSYFTWKFLKLQTRLNVFPLCLSVFILYVLCSCLLLIYFIGICVFWAANNTWLPQQVYADTDRSELVWGLKDTTRDTRFSVFSAPPSLACAFLLSDCNLGDRSSGLRSMLQRESGEGPCQPNLSLCQNRAFWEASLRRTLNLSWYCFKHSHWQIRGRRWWLSHSAAVSATVFGCFYCLSHLWKVSNLSSLYQYLLSGPICIFCMSLTVHIIMFAIIPLGIFYHF